MSMKLEFPTAVIGNITTFEKDKRGHEKFIFAAILYSPSPFISAHRVMLETENNKIECD